MTDAKEYKKASIYHLCDDMGGGAAFCGNCHEMLCYNQIKMPETCRKCGIKLVNDGGISNYAFDSSDL